MAHLNKCLAILILSLLISSCNRNELALDSQDKIDLLIKNINLFPDPETSVVNNASIAIKDGKITAILDVGSEEPEAQKVIDAQGAYASAGFWNCHVHLTEPQWQGADTIQVEKLQESLDKMFNQYGFTSVLDLGSNIKNTLVIKRRIETGELKGPRILSAGSGFTAEGASPSYIEEQLPQITSISDAKNKVKTEISAGAQHIKLYVGTFIDQSLVMVIPEDIAKAAVEESHNQNCLVSSHPHSLEGLVTSVNAGVDFLAHSVPDAGDLSDEILENMISKDVKLIPTLKLHRIAYTGVGLPEVAIDNLEEIAIRQVEDFKSRDGKICFGTDTGFISDYNPAEEFVLMEKANLSAHDILKSLTTEPEELLGDINVSGTVHVGKEANLVLLEKDPRQGAEHFSEVSYTIRKGEVIYEKK
ncbi:amidohydrolase family protein [Reichenbachiella versicolor]|uniref:amidohydrolase family protein n=1 Tax=Reichenbachiella versicolor TaxID=1821036 RepID=UPI000D6DD9A7|nr:amidohydrolase family protein [Reichenbachiella versicolor]